MAEIRVHDADDLRRGRSEARDDRRAEAQLPRTVNDAYVVLPREIVSDRARAVRRVVIDNDELELKTMAGTGREQCACQLRDPVTLIVVGTTIVKLGAARWRRRILLYNSSDR
jgi:hypothetical protein